MNRLRLIGKLLSSIVYRIAFILLVASGVLMVVMGLLVSQGVVRRYVFASPEPYSYELTCYLLLVCMLLPAVQVTTVGRHIRADLLFNRFPNRMQSFLRGFFNPIVGFFFCAIVAWKSWDVAWGSLQHGKVSTLSGVPIFAVQVVVPVATGLICLVLLSQIMGYLASIRGNARKSGSSA